MLFKGKFEPNLLEAEKERGCREGVDVVVTVLSTSYRHLRLSYEFRKDFPLEKFPWQTFVVNVPRIVILCRVVRSQAIEIRDCLLAQLRETISSPSLHPPQLGT
jgi:hypothetical protein